MFHRNTTQSEIHYAVLVEVIRNQRFPGFDENC